MGNYACYVVQKYYNRGAIKLKKITAEEAERLGYKNGQHKTHVDHEWHVSGFASEDTADEFINIVTGN